MNVELIIRFDLEWCPARSRERCSRSLGFLRHGSAIRNTASDRLLVELKRRKEEALHEHRASMRIFFPPHLAIPCWVAPQQSPTPFHQALIRSSIQSKVKVAHFRPNPITGLGQKWPSENRDNRNKAT